MPQRTLFERLLAGELPCHRVYEDERVFAILDVAPLAPGHLLVIPKEPAATMDALSDESAAALGRVLPRLTRAVQAATGVAAYNLLQNNGSEAHQAVPHVHVHIIPRPNQEEGLSMAWRPASLGADAAKLAGRIEAALAAAKASTVARST